LVVASQTSVSPRLLSLCFDVVMRTIKSPERLRVFIGLVVTLMFLAWAPKAGASMDPVLEENQSTVTEFAVRYGAVDVPGVGCGAKCQRLWDAVHDDAPATGVLGGPGEPAVKQLGGLMGATRLVAPLVEVAPVSAPFALGLGAFSVGLLIGTGAKAMYLHFTMPAQETPPPYGYRDQQFVKTLAPWVDALGTTHTESALVWNTCDGNCIAASPLSTSSWPARDYYPPIPQGDPNIEFRRGTLTKYWPGELGDIGWIDWSTVPSKLEPYTDQPVTAEAPTWADAPTDKADAETRVHDALDGGGYPALSEWLEAQLESAEVPDCDGLTWEDCRDAMEELGFVTPVKLTLPRRLDGAHRGRARQGGARGGRGHDTSMGGCARRGGDARHRQRPTAPARERLGRGQGRRGDYRGHRAVQPLRAGPNGAAGFGGRLLILPEPPRPL
jgi:hypothetical protein